MLPAVFINGGGFAFCARSYSRGLNGTCCPPKGGQDTADRVRMSRGTACVNRHQKYPPGGHGVPEITKNDSQTEIRTYPIAYTHQGVSGGG
jgi:hypothetical protein